MASKSWLWRSDSVCRPLLPWTIPRGWAPLVPNSTPTSLLVVLKLQMEWAKTSSMAVLMKFGFTLPGASKAVQKWLEVSGIDTLYVAPGSPWENGYVESSNSKLRDEFLNRELFLHIDELRYVADRWRVYYNHCRPHSSPDYMAPAVFAAKTSCEILS